MKASEVMIAEPVVAAAGATCTEVATLMRIKNISVVPVVDNPKDRRYQGTISDRDIVAACVGQGHDPRECSAHSHARHDTTVIAPDTELSGYRLKKQLDPADHHIRATMVVVDKTNRVVGFIPHPEEIVGVVVS